MGVHLRPRPIHKPKPRQKAGRRAVSVTFPAKITGGKMPNNIQEIVVTDIKIPFLSMVVLLVKWALAAIPAMIILIIIGMLLSMVVGAMFGGMFGWHGKMM
jgi:hypothetical protein